MVFTRTSNCGLKQLGSTNIHRIRISIRSEEALAGSSDATKLKHITCTMLTEWIKLDIVSKSSHQHKRFLPDN